MAQEEKTMLRFEPKRGPGNRSKNLALLLERLWEIADLNSVQQEQLGSTAKIRPYLQALEKGGYISLVKDVGRWHLLLYITLLKKSFKAEKIQDQPKKKKRLVADRPVELSRNAKEAPLAVSFGETAVSQPAIEIPAVEIPKETDDVPQPNKDKAAYTIAFIDFPNISSRGGNNKQSGDHYDIGLYRFNPMGLMGCLSHAGGDAVLVNEAYIYFKLPWDHERVTKRMEAAHIVPIYSSAGREDIDKIMLTHMMSKCYEILEDAAILNIIVVSGDHAFAHPIKAIKEAGHKKHVCVFAKVVSWKEKLASLLEQQADQVMYIDDIHEFIDQLGYKIGQTT